MNFVRSALFACALVMPAFCFAQEVSLPEGVTLPPTGTVFSLEGKTDIPVLQQLHPSEVTTNTHAGSNLARSLVYAGPRATFELAGLNSAVHRTGGDGSFLVRLAGDDPELMRRRVALVRLTQTTDRRIVSRYSQNMFGGQRSLKYEVIPATKTDIANSVWLKLTPESSLPPGEYGIVFMPKDPNFPPDAVYDFDVAFESAKPESRASR